MLSVRQMSVPSRRMLIYSKHLCRINHLIEIFSTDCYYSYCQSLKLILIPISLSLPGWRVVRLTWLERRSSINVWFFRVLRTISVITGPVRRFDSALTVFKVLFVPISSARSYPLRRNSHRMKFDSRRKCVFLTRPFASVMPTLDISSTSTVVFSFKALSKSWMTSGWISRMLLILILMKSLPFSLAFLTHPSTSVLLSGSRATVFNTSPLAAPKNRQSKINIVDDTHAKLLTIPTTTVGRDRLIRHCSVILHLIDQTSKTENGYERKRSLEQLCESVHWPASSTISVSLALVSTSSHSVATRNSSSSPVAGLVTAGGTQTLPFFSPGTNGTWSSQSFSFLPWSEMNPRSLSRS